MTHISLDTSQPNDILIKFIVDSAFKTVRLENAFVYDPNNWHKSHAEAYSIVLKYWHEVLLACDARDEYSLFTGERREQDCFDWLESEVAYHTFKAKGEDNFLQARLDLINAGIAHYPHSYDRYGTVTHNSDPHGAMYDIALWSYKRNYVVLYKHTDTFPERIVITKDKFNSDYRMLIK